MSLTFPSLFFIWIIPLVALPILIHLINLLRHRRVKWAAMDFLLESKKKNQNWVRLKQLLLLLARMAAIAAIVFLMAGPMLQDKWSKLFGGGKTHHVVLLDDSTSMSDRWGDTSAFLRGREVVSNIVARATRQSSEHSLTLLRYSHAAAGRQPEVLHRPVTAEFEVEFEQARDKLAETQLAVGPLEAIKTIEETIKLEDDENLIVYVVSDLRTQQWQDASALRQALSRLTDNDVQLQLVHCVDTTRNNLAITRLGPTPGQQAVGLLIRMEVEVTNFGKQKALNVLVQLDQHSYADASDVDGEVTSLGAIRIDSIGAGETVRREFDVTFNTAGDHHVTARLPSDPVAADNERFSIVKVAPQVPVLVIDGGGTDDPLFLRLAMPLAKTGLKTEVQSPSYLRENSLDEFHAIYLFNIAQLDPLEIDALEAYVRSGGGVMFFCGNETRRDFVNNSLYRDGEGLFPAALAAPATLLVDRLNKAPDLTVDNDHPIFLRTFAEKYNTWLQRILVERYYALAKDWRADDDPNVSVIASLRNGAPLIIEKKYGQGRVLAMLTTSAPVWHNWGLMNPTFIVGTLETQVYLGALKTAQAELGVGSPLEIELAADDYDPELVFAVPKENSKQVITAFAKPQPGKEQAATSLADTPRSGVYEARLQRADGVPETRRFAINVDTAESDLETVEQGELQSLMGNVPFQYKEAGEFLAPIQQQAGFPLGQQWWFFLGLIAMLVVEQLLAYSASYHPPLTGGKR